MQDSAFEQAWRRLRRLHYLHYPAQGLLMAAAVLVAGRRVAGPASDNPRLATWSVLLGVLALLAVVGVLLHFVASYIRPNPRRPAAENLRLYQGRLLLRNSLLGLAGLPPLAAYALRGEPVNLLFFGVLLLVPCLLTAPSARTYQRWLLS